MRSAVDRPEISFIEEWLQSVTVESLGNGRVITIIHASGYAAANVVYVALA